jgi:hypothetical protein
LNHPIFSDSSYGAAKIATFAPFRTPLVLCGGWLLWVYLLLLRFLLLLLLLFLVVFLVLLLSLLVLLSKL